jgi:hypothetical protein
MLKDEFLSRLQGNAHRGVSPKSDNSNSQFSTQISLVVFGGDVRRTEGVNTKPLSRLPLAIARVRCPPRGRG